MLVADTKPEPYYITRLKNVIRPPTDDQPPYQIGAGKEFPIVEETGFVFFDDRERELLVDALGQAEGNQSEAARILKISRDRMRYKMAKYNLR